MVPSLRTGLKCTIAQLPWRVPLLRSRRGPTRWERGAASVDAEVPISFKPAAILAGEIALSHRTRPDGLHHVRRRGGGLGHAAVSMSRQAPPSGAAVRSRQSRPLSHPQRALQSRGDTPGWPRETYWCRSTPLAPRVRHFGVRMDCNRGNPRTIVGLLLPADRRCRLPYHRSRSWQQRRHAHRPTVAPSDLSRRRSHSYGLPRCGSPPQTVVYRASSRQGHPARAVAQATT